MKKIIKSVFVIIVAIVIYLLGYNTEKPREALYEKVLNDSVFFEFIKKGDSIEGVYLSDNGDYLDKKWDLEEDKTLFARYYYHGKSTLMYVGPVPTSQWVDIEIKEVDTFANIFFNGPDENQFKILDECLNKALSEKIVYSCIAEDVGL